MVSSHIFYNKCWIFLLFLYTLFYLYHLMEIWKREWRFIFWCSSCFSSMIHICPYFRCHYANVSLSLCLCLIKVIFRYLPFPLCLLRNVFFQFYSYMFLFFSTFFRLCHHPFEWKNPFQSRVWQQQGGWSVICPLYSPHELKLTASVDLISHLSIRLLYIASSISCDS